MKKVMIGILVLIPIIIVIVVGLVTRFVSTRTHIAVEEIKIDVESLELELKDVPYVLNDLIKVEILPEKATDKSFTWTINNLQTLDKDYEDLYEAYLAAYDEYQVKLRNYKIALAEYNEAYHEWMEDKTLPEPVRPVEPAAVDVVQPAACLVDKDNVQLDPNPSTAGLLKINAYCSFDLVIQAETMSATCSVYVGGEDLRTIKISSGTTSIQIGQAMLMSHVFAPVDSKVTSAYWESDNKAVATVDNNGIVHGVAAGKANITMFAMGSDGEYIQSNSFELTVTEGVSSIFGSRIYVHKTNFKLSDIGLDGFSAFDGCNIIADQDGGYDVTISEDVEATISVPNKGDMTVIYCGGEDIAIQNADIIGFDDNKTDNFVFAAKEIPLALKAVWKSSFKDGTPDNIIWSSDNTAVATVSENGVVSGHKSGFAIITAKRGANEAKIKLHVELKVATLIISMSDSKLAVGIARETVFGSTAYSDVASGTLVPYSFEIDFKYPRMIDENTDAFYDLFTFEVSNGNIAYFEKNKLIFKPENITERTSIIVTVRAKYPKYPSVPNYTTCSFTVNVVPGVSVSTFEETKRATDDRKTICLMNDIKLIPDAGQTRSDGLNLFGSLYGNNRIFSADRGVLNSTSAIFAVRGSNQVISNLIIRSSSVGDEISSHKESLELTGYCLRVQDYVDANLYRVENLRIEYSIIENGGTGIGAYGADIVVEGVIIRNIGGTGIYIHQDINDKGPLYNNITVKNVIISNIAGIAVNFGYSGFSDTTEKKVRADAYYAEGKGGSFTQLGFLDIYNWHTIDSLNLFNPDDLDESIRPLVGILTNALGNELKQGEFKKLWYTYKKEDYLNLGVLAFGLLEKSYATFNFEQNKRFTEVDTKNIDLVLDRFKESAYLYMYNGSEDRVVPGATYKIDKDQIDKLHGQKS